MTDLQRHRLFRRFSQLTLTIIGQSIDHRVIETMGSAFFLAPYTAVTAAHVVDALWDQLRMPWEKGKYPKKAAENAFYAVMCHVPDPDRPDDLARWQATSAVKSCYRYRVHESSPCQSDGGTRRVAVVSEPHADSARGWL
jgi:hypothetical protein